MELDTKDIKSISADELNSFNDVELIDIRDEIRWEEGHIPGAKQLSYSKLKVTSDWASKFDKSKKYVIYCKRGIRCQEAALRFKELGFNLVAYLEGGLNEYKGELEAD